MFLTLAKFFIPILLGLSIFAILGLTLEEQIWMKLWPLLVAYFFPPFGKETVIPLGVLGGNKTVPIINLHIHIIPIDPILVALSVAFIDIIVALFLVWNYDLAKKIPLVGKFMIRIEEKGKLIEKKYRWVKPLRFIGIMLFVMIPLQGSGGLVASIVGRLIGMRPWNTFFAISLGAVIGCLVIAFLAKSFIFFAEINTVLTVSLLMVVVFILAIYVSIKKLKENVKKKR